MKLIIAFLASLLVVAPAFAGVSIRLTEKKPVGSFAEGTGARIELQVDDRAPVEGMFLARVEKVDGPPQWMLLADDARQVYLVDEKDLKITSGEDATSGEFQRLVHPVDQEGGTCAAFAMYHMTLQLEKAGQIKLGLDNEGRLKLLSYYISEYYLDGSRRESIEKIMGSMGKKFGFKCDTRRFDDSTQALVYLEEELSEGHPVLVEFDVGTDMVSSPYSTADYSHPSTTPDDPRLWVPRQVGQRDGGGHAIVLATGFADHGHAMAVALDSDWATPRIWSLEDYLPARTRMDLVLFHGCR